MRDMWPNAYSIPQTRCSRGELAEWWSGCGENPTSNHGVIRWRVPWWWGMLTALWLMGEASWVYGMERRG